MTQEEKDFIHNSASIKPSFLKISDKLWTFIIYSAMEGENILLAGYTGGGKTTLAKCLATVLDRPFFKISMASTQDPRATLIGNTFFDPLNGTILHESDFVKAIQTKNAIILLDEYSRASADAENILLTVLDHQRYLRLDEDKEQRTINVADGVCFIATANFGNEFKTTRDLDRATIDRFPCIVEMKLLSKEEELELLTEKFPNVSVKDLDLLTTITSTIREGYLSEEQLYSNMISTRMSESIAKKLNAGFNLLDIFDITIYPLFDDIGGADSERLKVKLVVDKLIPKGSANKIGKNGKISPSNIFQNIKKNKSNSNP